MAELFPNCNSFSVKKNFFPLLLKVYTQLRKSARYNFELSIHSRLTSPNYYKFKNNQCIKIASTLTLQF